MRFRAARMLSTLAAATVLVAGCGANPAAPAASVSSSVPAGPQASASTPAAAPASSATASTPTPAPTPSATAGSGWTALGTLKPSWVLRNKAALQPSGQDPKFLAYCTVGAVEVSRDGGTTWTAVATAGVPTALTQSGYALPAPNGQTPACDSAVADPGHEGSVYAAFSVGSAKYGMPPVYHVALQTTDSGAHWSVVPTPVGFTPGDFGGFAVASGAVQAMYGQNQGKLTYDVFATTDGGAHWQDYPLACQGAGPCVLWGPAPSGIGSCAMHAYPQPVLRSADAGKLWASAQQGPVDELSMLANSCALNELVGIGSGRALLVANGPAGETHALRVSSDNGKTWSDVSLPTLPNKAQPMGLQMLPDGSLLATGSGQTAGSANVPLPLDLLKPGAPSWCVVPGLTLHGSTTDPQSVQVIGSRLWWLERGNDGKPAPYSAPLTDVHC